MIKNENLKGVPLLVLANKQDLPGRIKQLITCRISFSLYIVQDIFLLYQNLITFINVGRGKIFNLAQNPNFIIRNFMVHRLFSNISLVNMSYQRIEIRCSYFYVKLCQYFSLVDDIFRVVTAISSQSRQREISMYQLQVGEKLVPSISARREIFLVIFNV